MNINNIIAIIIICFVTSCMKLYSYPTSGPKIPQMPLQQNMKMPPDFQKQMMQMGQPKPPRPVKTPPKPNPVTKYPGNVPYPYGMRKKFKRKHDRDASIRQLEELSKGQYRGDLHYRSTQLPKNLND